MRRASSSRERPRLHSRQLLAEECVGVRDGLVEGARQPVLQRVAVVLAEDAPAPRVDGGRRVTCSVALESGRGEVAGEA